jgi:excisionase family DNA binding protein
MRAGASSIYFFGDGEMYMDAGAQGLYQVTFRGYPDVLNVKQVGELLGVSSKTVYRLINGGDLTSIKVGREFRIPKVILMKYMKMIGQAAVPSR